jgi:hypothetical protein
VHRSKCQLHVSPYRREDNAGSWAVSAIAHVARRRRAARTGLSCRRRR